MIRFIEGIASVGSVASEGREVNHTFPNKKREPFALIHEEVFY